MNNSVYEVELNDYKTFIGQLNLNMMDLEKFSLEDCNIIKIISKNTGKHLSTRIQDNKNQKEHYYIFNYPEPDERINPKPVLQIDLKTKKEVQIFFDLISKLQKEGKE